MINGSNERLDRIEKDLQETAETLKIVARRQEEMAARQQYHDEAFERTDAMIKRIAEVVSQHTDQLRADGEHIRALARIAEAHQRRLERLEGSPE